jgi:hypothetical protein
MKPFGEEIVQDWILDGAGEEILQRLSDMQ